MGATTIQWTATPRPDGTFAQGYTFNPWRGCTKVSEGCRSCYAEAGSKRNLKVLGQWGPQGTRVVAAESTWREPLKWDRQAKEAGERRKVFCASIADVFEDWTGLMVDAQGRTLFQCCQCKHQWAADMAGYDPTKQDCRIICQECLSCGPNEMSMVDVRQRLFNLIRDTEHLDWLLLTKRPENVEPMMRRLEGWALCNLWDEWNCYPDNLHNVWLGTSVENQATADERIPHLLRVPARVRFLSVEPLLGPVNLHLGRSEGRPTASEPCRERADLLRWVIAGGESGPHARPCDVAWIRSLVEQCRAAGTACFVKQMGANVRWDGCQGGYMDGTPNVWPDGTRKIEADGGWRVILRDQKGGDPNEFPADIRVRQFPE